MNFEEVIHVLFVFRALSEAHNYCLILLLTVKPHTRTFVIILIIIITIIITFITIINIILFFLRLSLLLNESTDTSSTDSEVESDEDCTPVLIYSDNENSEDELLKDE